MIVFYINKFWTTVANTKNILLAFLISIVHISSFALTTVNAIYGNGHRLEDRQQWRLRFESITQFRYGDNFFFFEVQNPTADGTNIYSEYAPRLSLSKISEHKVGAGIVKDTLLAAQLNYNGTGFRAYLYPINLKMQVLEFENYQ